MMSYQDQVYDGKDPWEFKKNELVKCKKCDHVLSLHHEDSCLFVKRVTDDGKEWKLCGCTEIEK